MTAILIHGGAHKREGGAASEAEYARALRRAVDRGYEMLARSSAMECVVATVSLLEDDPLFNAGLGSRVQHDGQIRMSAALVDADRRSFTGVVNIRNVKNPIQVAQRLQSERHGVLGGNEAMEFAFRHGFGYFDPMTPQRWKEHLDGIAGESSTVGVIAIDAQGRLCAGTSTGGIGNETAGRISDSATVAGIYASGEMGVTCTGRGEDIIRFAVAARIVAFHQAGASPVEAAARVVEEGSRDEARFALIGLTRTGEPITAGTRGTAAMFAFRDAQRSCDFTTAESLGP